MAINEHKLQILQYLKEKTGLQEASKDELLANVPILKRATLPIYLNQLVTTKFLIELSNGKFKITKKGKWKAL